MLQINTINKSQNKYNVIQKATKPVMAFQNLMFLMSVHGTL